MEVKKLSGQEKCTNDQIFCIINCRLQKQVQSDLIVSTSQFFLD